MTLAKATKYKVIVSLPTGPKSTLTQAVIIEGANPPVVGDRVLLDGDKRPWTIISVIAIIGPDFVEGQ